MSIFRRNYLELDVPFFFINRDLWIVINVLIFCSSVLEEVDTFLKGPLDNVGMLRVSIGVVYGNSWRTFKEINKAAVLLFYSWNSDQSKIISSSLRYNIQVLINVICTIMCSYINICPSRCDLRISAVCSVGILACLGVCYWWKK